MSRSEKADSEDIIKLEEEISNFFEDLMYDWGGSPLLGRIYALCVLTTPDKPLFQKDLADRFNVDPSTISRNLKELENWRLIGRRREPGSREWRFQAEDTSFLELLVLKFEENAMKLRARLDELIRIRNRWSETLSDKSKEALREHHALLVLNKLIEWIRIVDKELDEFIQKLNVRFLELEKKFEQIEG
ncbi:GbsR/MarR family transcriptional regulator [Candidatus Borrarchaeum sp.]|uniref:GbsR/MarR family transcriptional regulator n=1 Tax=Candidatus Borrarchaeum sp. TaxID=2846742 RepID=UPI00257EE74E|nr:MarR family transcriptional regulator [Candidatus Borrarchaeum sp.]